jgi:hypothetical protein
VLSTWGAGHDPSAGFAAWALAGPVVVTAVLAGAAAFVRRRRG